MRILMLNVVFVFVVLFSNSLNADESSAQNDSCELISLFTTDGPQSAIEKISEMFSWNENLANKITKILFILKDYKYVDGNVYVVADFGGLAEHYLMVLSTIKNGALYAHLSFEKFNHKLTLISIDFKDNYKELIDLVGPFSQSPEHVNC